MAGPAPAKFIFDKPRCSVPPRFIIDIIFCIQFSPVMRTSFFTSGNSPQKVKNTVVCMPIAAAVVARMNVGQIRSRSPLHAKITRFVCLALSCSCAASSARIAASISS